MELHSRGDWVIDGDNIRKTTQIRGHKYETAP